MHVAQGITTLTMDCSWWKRLLHIGDGRHIVDIDYFQVFFPRLANTASSALEDSVRWRIDGGPWELTTFAEVRPWWARLWLYDEAFRMLRGQGEKK